MLASGLSDSGASGGGRVDGRGERRGGGNIRTSSLAMLYALLAVKHRRLCATESRLGLVLLLSE